MALPFTTHAGTALRISSHASLRRHSTYGSPPLIGRGFANRANNGTVLLTRGRPNAVVWCRNADWEQGNARLEEEVLEFMEASERPNHFPSKEDLLSAGRSDLVREIISHGGWLAAGWDSQPLHVSEDDADEDSTDSDVDEDEDDYDDGFFEIEKKPPALHTIDVKAEDVSEKSRAEETGIAGMINRLERERALSYSEAASAGEERNGLHKFNGSVESWKTVPGIHVSVNGKGKADDGSFTVNKSRRNVPSLERDAAKVEYENRDLDLRENFIKPKKWGIPNVQDMGDVEIETKDEPDVPDGFWERSRGIGEQISSQAMDINDNTSVFVDGVNEIIDRRQEWMWNVKTSYSSHSQQIYPKDGPNTIRSRIQKLEVQLASSLGSLRSRKDAFHINKDYDKNSLQQLEKASDAIEFRETEIMKMRAKLRSTRAKLAALEGKMAMEIMEVRKAIEEKQKKVEEAQKVLSLLRTARIVWPDSASEVFLAGSFDGWTTQRRMGKSNAGVFVISLHLYPGRYEIKFIVDGVWRVDQQRPIVYNNGFENNLLVIY